jgi:hypothetical protein
MSGRTAVVLDRFPRHMAAADPGKRFEVVADALGAELDVKTSQLGRVRRAHALATADEERDLLLLAALHGLRDEDFELLRVRLAAVRVIRADLPAEEALERLPAVLGVRADAFQPFPGEDDGEPARERLGAALGALASYGSELDLLRGSLAGVIGRHRDGNGTAGGLLGAAAAYLGLEPTALAHSDDRFWHLERCRDRMRLVRPEPPGTVPAETRLTPDEDVLALEENPFQSKDISPIPRRHRDVFRILRGGFEPVTVTVRVRGVADRTVAPMVVNLDSGHGVAFTGTVPAGQELRFESDGRVTLAGASVARLSYAFRGAVFADAGGEHRNDFLFDAATFAETEPVPDAFEPGAAFPHAEGLLGGVEMALGESRWGFSVGAAHYGRDDPDPAQRPAIPLFAAGFFDRTVFEPAADPAGEVGFDWEEREPFALTVWIPQRFSQLDEDGELPVRERLRLLLGRHRAAGVHVYCRYADDRWSLGQGVVREPGATDPRGIVVVGTRLWPEDTTQPTPA